MRGFLFVAGRMKLFGMLPGRLDAGVESPEFYGLFCFGSESVMAGWVTLYGYGPECVA